MSNKVVYVPKPELTFFRDTFLQCELINTEKRNQCRLRVRSVLMGDGNPVPDLTAEYEDAIVIVNCKRVYDSIERMKSETKNLV